MGTRSVLVTNEYSYKSGLAVIASSDGTIRFSIYNQVDGEIIVASDKEEAQQLIRDLMECLELMGR